MISWNFYHNNPYIVVIMFDCMGQGYVELVLRYYRGSGSSLDISKRDIGARGLDKLLRFVFTKKRELSLLRLQ